MEEDWLDQFHDCPLPKDWKPGSYLGVENVVFPFTEIFEFASRLSLTEAGDELMHMEIDLRGLRGRGLKLESFSKGSSYLGGHKAHKDTLPYVLDLTRTELITASKELSLKPAIELFKRFGWDPSLEVLRDIQGELLGYKSAAVGRDAP